MPVVKITMGPKFLNLKVDMTFQAKNHTGVRCSQLINEFLMAMPIIKPLVLFLKSLVCAYNLSDPYTGGIGSYSITLMVIALLQVLKLSFSVLQDKKTMKNLPISFYSFSISMDNSLIISPRQSLSTLQDITNTQCIASTSCL